MDAVPDDESDLETMRDDWSDRIREIAEACREKFDNLPEGFQMGGTGMLLEERADATEQWGDDVAGIDVEWNQIKHAGKGMTWDDHARELLDEMASGCPE